jgi:hypothetical protein
MDLIDDMHGGHFELPLFLERHYGMGLENLLRLQKIYERQSTGVRLIILHCFI